jgi:prepilin signal peptidase PulO-like enzyme (type II secretory pathway)
MKLTDWGEWARSTIPPLWPVITLTIGVAALLLWILMMGRAIWNLLGLGILW